MVDYTPRVWGSEVLTSAGVNGIEQGLATTSATANAAVSGVAALKVDKGERFAAKLTQGVTPVTVAVAGDSTGDGTNEWFHLAWQRWAVVRPWLTLTFRAWSNATQSYGSPTTIQTGTGSQTIDLYGGSHSGSVLTYQSARLALMYPVPVDLLFISSSHNYGQATSGTAYVALVDAFVDAFRAVQPAAGIVVSSQNPQYSPVSAPGIAAQADRLSVLPGYAAARGFGYLPVAEVWARSTNAGPGGLTQADGVHPSTGGVNGSRRWSQVAIDYIDSLTWQP